MEREQRRLDNQNATRPGRRPGRCAARHAARRRGFTLLEILVVIGIILLLVGIGVIGFRALDQSGRVTETTLKNLQAMLGEYEAMTALREQPPYAYVGGSRVEAAKLKEAGGSFWELQAMINAATGGNGDVKSGSKPRYEWDAVANTQVALMMFNRVPANKQLMTQFPSRQVHGTPSGPKGGKLAPDKADDRIDPPLILDAWGNPIVFVGKYGLQGVNLLPKSGATGGGTTSAAQYEFPNRTILSTGHMKTGDTPPRSARPFFASAGPDGDFRTGDDNVYSFNF